MKDSRYCFPLFSKYFYEKRMHVVIVGRNNQRVDSNQIVYVAANYFF